MMIKLWRQKGEIIQLLRIFHNIYASCRMAWTNTMSLKPKQSCIDCHFFVEGDRENTVLIKASERESLRQGNNPWATRDLAFSCSFGVWDEGLAPFDFL